MCHIDTIKRKIIEVAKDESMISFLCGICAFGTSLVIFLCPIVFSDSIDSKILFILSFGSFVNMYGFAFSIIAIIFGILSKRKYKEACDQGIMRRAKIGLVLGIAWLILAALSILTLVLFGISGHG